MAKNNTNEPGKFRNTVKKVFQSKSNNCSRSAFTIERKLSLQMHNKFRQTFENIFQDWKSFREGIILSIWL